MQLAGVELDEAVFASILCASANLGALETGIWVHRYLDRVEFPRSVRLGTALIDMYAKWGHLDLAENVFEEMPQRDTVCWNAMISGWAMHGNGDRALQMFSEMEKAGIRPDDITFIAVFTACGYSAMAYEGLRVFSILWRALMSACSSHGNIRLGEVAAEKLLELVCHSGAYVLLSNLYSTFWRT
ncbi:hypothetical protein RHMOL_Rhmol12G0156600 [Rhododendron molle]|uniref:Uncharacterized protein n=1 Tax=Rhododendron molle TaxID=49168 RepID=A0ACC0LJ33_RHOML|nr:hypothetical protein RHMOL_Rhmol12G0156600 [Rhododendron molle]